MPHKIFIYAPIGASIFSDGVNVEQVSKEITSLKKGTDIELRINSPGGNAWDGIALYNVLKGYDGKVTAYVDGIAASAASIIAMGADEIVMGQGSQLMIHQASGVAMGTAEDMLATAEVLESVTSQMIGVYESRTGLPLDEITAMVEAETWLDADKAISLKFADQTSAEKAKVKSEHIAFLEGYKHTPAALLQQDEPQPEPEKPDYTELLAEMDRLFI